MIAKVQSQKIYLVELDEAEKCELCAEITNAEVAGCDSYALYKLRACLAGAE